MEVFTDGGFDVCPKTTINTRVKAMPHNNDFTQ